MIANLGLRADYITMANPEASLPLGGVGVFLCACSKVVFAWLGSPTREVNRTRPRPRTGTAK